MAHKRGGNRSCTPHEKKHTNRCEFCGEAFECSRELAKTCSPNCRNSLSRYIKKHGHAPLNPKRRPYPGAHL